MHFHMFLFTVSESLLPKLSNAHCRQGFGASCFATDKIFVFLYVLEISQLTAKKSIII